MERRLKINTSVLSKVLGYESSTGGMSGGDRGTKGRLLEKYSADTLNKASVILSSNIPKLQKLHFASEEQAEKEAKCTATQGISRLARNIIEKKAVFDSLPEQIKGGLVHIRETIEAASNAMAATTAGTVAYESNAFKYKQACIALESSVFNTFARINDSRNQRQIHSQLGLESAGTMTYDYMPNYPVLEANIQWVNVPGITYPKVVPIRHVVDTKTQIPVETRKIVYFKLDDNGVMVEGSEIDRADLYSKMVPEVGDTSKEFFDSMMNVKEVVITKAEYDLPIVLHKTVIASLTTPILNPKEAIRPQFTIVAHKLADGTVGGPIVESTKGVFVQEATFNEMNEKGALIKYTPVATVPTEFYYVGVRYDYKEGSPTVSFVITKSVTTMQDIDEITVRFPLNDVNNVNISAWSSKVVNYRRYLEAPEETQSQPFSFDTANMSIANERAGMEIQNLILTEMSSTYGHAKEAEFKKTYNKNKEVVKALDAALKDKSQELYQEREIDLNLLMTVNKIENIGLLLGKNFDTIQTNFKARSNTDAIPQMNLVTSTISIPVIKNSCSIIVGDVGETSNGEFLGVKQTDATYVLTVGDANNSAHSIVVGSDKLDLRPTTHSTTGDKLAPAEQVHNYDIIPIFREANLATAFMVEAPLSILNGAEGYNNIRNLGIPALFYKTSFAYRTFRFASGHIKITGDLVSAQ